MDNLVIRANSTFMTLLISFLAWFFSLVARSSLAGFFSSHLRRLSPALALRNGNAIRTLAPNPTKPSSMFVFVSPPRFLLSFVLPLSRRLSPQPQPVRQGQGVVTGENQSPISYHESHG